MGEMGEFQNLWVWGQLGAEAQWADGAAGLCGLGLESDCCNNPHPVWPCRLPVQGKLRRRKSHHTLCLEAPTWPFSC